MRVRTIILALCLLLVLLQYRLWFSTGGVAETLSLNRSIQSQIATNHHLKDYNNKLNKEIYLLGHYPTMTKMLARRKFNMVKHNEVYYDFVNVDKSR